MAHDGDGGSGETSLPAQLQRDFAAACAAVGTDADAQSAAWAQLLRIATIYPDEMGVRRRAGSTGIADGAAAADRAVDAATTRRIRRRSGAPLHSTCMDVQLGAPPTTVPPTPPWPCTGSCRACMRRSWRGTGGERVPRRSGPPTPGGAHMRACRLEDFAITLPLYGVLAQCIPHDIARIRALRAWVPVAIILHGKFKQLMDVAFANRYDGAGADGAPMRRGRSHTRTWPAHADVGVCGCICVLPRLCTPPARRRAPAGPRN